MSKAKLKVSAFRVIALKILGRVGTHLKKIDRNTFQNAFNYIFPENLKKILRFTRNLDRVGLL